MTFWGVLGSLLFALVSVAGIGHVSTVGSSVGFISEIHYADSSGDPDNLYVELYLSQPDSYFCFKLAIVTDVDGDGQFEEEIVDFLSGYDTGSGTRDYPDSHFVDMKVPLLSAGTTGLMLVAQDGLVCTNRVFDDGQSRVMDYISYEGVFTTDATDYINDVPFEKTHTSVDVGVTMNSTTDPLMSITRTALDTWSLEPSTRGAPNPGFTLDFGACCNIYPCSLEIEDQCTSELNGVWRGPRSTCDDCGIQMPRQDLYVNEAATTTNYGLDETMEVHTEIGKMKISLLWFDVFHQIQDLSVYVTGTGPSSPVTIEIWIATDVWCVGYDEDDFTFAHFLSDCRGGAVYELREKICEFTVVTDARVECRVLEIAEKWRRNPWESDSGTFGSFFGIVSQDNGTDFTAIIGTKENSDPTKRPWVTLIGACCDDVTGGCTEGLEEECAGRFISETSCDGYECVRAENTCYTSPGAARGYSTKAQLPGLFDTWVQDRYHDVSAEECCSLCAAKRRCDDWQYSKRARACITWSVPNPAFILSDPMYIFKTREWTTSAETYDEPL